MELVEAPKLTKKDMYASDKNLALMFRGDDSKAALQSIQIILREMESFSELDKYFLYIGKRTTNIYVFEKYVLFRKRNLFERKKEPISKFIEELDL